MWRRRHSRAVASSSHAFGLPFSGRHSWGLPGRRTAFCRPVLCPLAGLAWYFTCRVNTDQCCDRWQDQSELLRKFQTVGSHIYDIFCLSELLFIRILLFGGGDWIQPCFEHYKKNHFEKHNAAQGPWLPLCSKPVDSGLQGAQAAHEEEITEANPSIVTWLLAKSSHL